MRCPWLLAEMKVATILDIIGPSGVRALHLAAGINVGGHYFWYCQAQLQLAILDEIELW